MSADGLPGELGAELPDGTEAFIVDLDGFEGPIDMLLAMARTQKVDLRRISVLSLVEQYLGFVAAAERLRIELAADYLVMAAWLAFLKSRLMLPAPQAEDGPSGEDLAELLQLRLERLDAMRTAGAALLARDRLGETVFARGAPETPVTERRVSQDCSLAELLRAYARIRTREEYRPLQIDRREIFEVEAALGRLRRLLGAGAPVALLAVVPEDWRSTPARRRSALAASLMAALELARDGEATLVQDAPFAEIRLAPR